MGKYFSCKWKRRENTFHENGKDRRMGVAMLLSNKIDIQMKAIKKDKEGHYLMIKGLIQEENITFTNIYAP